MKNIFHTTHKNILQEVRNHEGFTFLEVLISTVILSIGIFGLIKTADSVIYYQNQARQITEATFLTTNKIEEVKLLSTNEPTGGSFGFNYLVSDYLTDEGLTQVDDQTYTKSETDGDYTVTWTLQVYPPGATGTFDEPTSISILEVLVTTTWTDSRSQDKDVELASVIHRRQFIE